MMKRSLLLLGIALSMSACGKDSSPVLQDPSTHSLLLEGKACVDYESRVTEHTLAQCMEALRAWVASPSFGERRCRISDTAKEDCRKELTVCSLPQSKCFGECLIACDTAYEAAPSVDALLDCRAACSAHESGCAKLGSSCGHAYAICLKTAKEHDAEIKQECIEALQSTRIEKLQIACQSSNAEAHIAPEIECGRLLGLGSCVRAKGICSR